MSDLVGASTLLLTVVTLLYTVWYAEIHEARSTPFPAGGPPNARDAIKDVRRVLFTRALPLAVVASVAAIIFAQPAIAIVIPGVPNFLANPLKNWNAVESSLVLVWIFTVFLAVALIIESLNLRQRASKLSDPDSYGKSMSR